MIRKVSTSTCAVQCTVHDVHFDSTVLPILSIGSRLSFGCVPQLLRAMGLHAGRVHGIGCPEHKYQSERLWVLHGAPVAVRECGQYSRARHLRYQPPQLCD